MVRSTTVKGLHQMISEQANDEHIDAANRGENPPTAPPSAFRSPPAALELPEMPEHADSAPSTPDPIRHDPSAWGQAEDADRKARTIWPVRQTAEFDGDMLVDAPDLWRVAQYLTNAIGALSSLNGVSIGWYWRRQGGRSHGDPVLVRVNTAAEELVQAREFDIVVKFSADHLRKMRASELYIEYLVLGALVRIESNGPKVLPSSIWPHLPGWFRYGYLGPQDRLFGSLVGRINAGHDADVTVAVEVGDADAGVQTDADGTPLSDAQKAEQTAAEERDDDAPDEIVDEVMNDPTPIRPTAADQAEDDE